MNDEQESESYRLVAWVLGIAVAVALIAAIVPGIVAGLAGGSGSAGATAPAAAAALPAAAPAAAQPAAAPQPAAAAPSSAAAAGSAPAAQSPGPDAVMAKLHFASGKTDLPADAAGLLQPVVESIKAGRAAKAVVSGFHDKTGDPEKNAELAKQRAFAVRDELTKAGLSEAQIELKKPQETEGGTDDREARRVEVSAVR